MLRNSVGVHPLIILNILINADRDEKPQLTATSVIELRGSVSSASAKAIRFWLTYLKKVTPVHYLNTLEK